jgi:hypothetical protein
MITLPADIKKDDNWNGYSMDQGAQVKNLDSGMGFPEHQRIVCAAKTFIATMAYSDEELGENVAREALMILKEAFTDPDGGAVYITKGIHQPNYDPHIQLKVDGHDRLFHLNVSAEENVQAIDGHGFFHWKAVSVSARVRNHRGDPETQFDYAQWPAGVAAKLRRDANRRNSISSGRLLTLNAEIQAELDRARAQSERDTLKNKIVAAALKLGLTPKNLRDTGKLLDGETVTFLTKSRIEKACTFDKATNKFTYGGTTTTISMS